MKLSTEEDQVCTEVHELILPKNGRVPLIKGNYFYLPNIVKQYLTKWIAICKPRAVYVCDGEYKESEEILKKLLDRNIFKRLYRYENNFRCNSDPNDVYLIHSFTASEQENKYKIIPHIKEDVLGELGMWRAVEELSEKCNMLFAGCMAGRIMYVVPFIVGAVCSKLSRIGVQLTDNAYTVMCLRTIAPICLNIWKMIEEQGHFIKCLHSVGLPRVHTKASINDWPCNLENAFVAHIPEENMIVSFGSAYGGNSILPLKHVSVKLAAYHAHREGWLAENMLILSVTNPDGEEKFIAAAIPEGCGGLTMSMMSPSLPCWKVQCVGDQVAWLRFDNEGVLRATNPLAGFYSNVNSINRRTSPNTCATLIKNTIFTNIAETDEGYFFWEGLASEYPEDTEVETWQRRRVRMNEANRPAVSHPNAKFCCPAGNSPIIHPKWNDPKGVPISAIIFATRRYQGIPLVCEAFNWRHGVMLGAQLKLDAKEQAKIVHSDEDANDSPPPETVHNPMCILPYLSYNLGLYLQHWLDMEQPGRQMPGIFQVNWFLKAEPGLEPIWPGFGENIRILDWILRRTAGQEIGQPSALGFLPQPGSINMSGLNIERTGLFRLSREFLLADHEESLRFFEQQLPEDLPQAIAMELQQQMQRIMALP